MHSSLVHSLAKGNSTGSQQWCNIVTVTLATPRGDIERGCQIALKMWDNFAALTAQLAKLCVLLNNLFILKDLMNDIFVIRVELCKQVLEQFQGIIFGEIWLLNGRPLVCHGSAADPCKSVRTSGRPLADPLDVDSRGPAAHSARVCHGPKQCRVHKKEFAAEPPRRTLGGTQCSQKDRRGRFCCQSAVNYFVESAAGPRPGVH